MVLNACFDCDGVWRFSVLKSSGRRSVIFAFGRGEKIATNMDDEAVEKLTGLVPEAWFDLIARVIPGAIILVVTTQNTTISNVTIGGFAICGVVSLCHWHGVRSLLLGLFRMGFRCLRQGCSKFIYVQRSDLGGNRHTPNEFSRASCENDGRRNHVPVPVFLQPCSALCFLCCDEITYIWTTYRGHPESNIAPFNLCGSGSPFNLLLVENGDNRFVATSKLAATPFDAVSLRQMPRIGQQDFHLVAAGL